ncbi:helical backbone metal receptor [Nocardioides perillae]|uniref:ABC-type Fe3+-hydroxamate transport system substrate-binding protein n=1 Tax=Nocardioides perillae TaxID=1119534 RepID=A0A7Y9ULV6_9ACTN|nr:helical backbone metal receptor [Nocardioides perillae]NYG54746.1 ABC-type Fe3+-hydroxamate transport system substrate-binding protein [Nocardioides perillae]
MTSPPHDAPPGPRRDGDPADDLGHPYAGARPAQRVVSLVPSLTEAIASVRPEALVAATQWCTHPGDLDVPRVRGTKNPDTKAIAALAPDLVVANKEENRELDVRRLRDAGVPVWVTDVETVPQGVAAIERLFDDALGWERPAWLAEARRLWCGPVPPVSRRVAVAIWRDPWMVVGGRTFTGDLVRRLGWDNVFADRPERYPAVDLADLDAAGADAVLLPDEPYVFTADDGPEAFARTPTELVSGRLLTWYGPSLLDAARLLSAAVEPTPRG